jgi:hypothetical protein
MKLPEVALVVAVAVAHLMRHIEALPLTMMIGTTCQVVVNIVADPKVLGSLFQITYVMMMKWRIVGIKRLQIIVIV